MFDRCSIVSASRGTTQSVCPDQLGGDDGAVFEPTRSAQHSRPSRTFPRFCTIGLHDSEEAQGPEAERGRPAWHPGRLRIRHHHQRDLLQVLRDPKYRKGAGQECGAPATRAARPVGPTGTAEMRSLRRRSLNFGYRCHTGRRCWLLMVEHTSKGRNHWERSTQRTAGQLLKVETICFHDLAFMWPDYGAGRPSTLVASTSVRSLEVD
jgi:hypothetical protein